MSSGIFGREESGIRNDEVLKSFPFEDSEGSGLMDESPDLEESDLSVSEEAVKPRRILTGPRKGRKLVRPEEKRKRTYTPQERLLLLDTWQRSGLPAKDFGAMVGVGHYTLYKWKRLFDEYGPEGLMDRPKGPAKGSTLSDITKRAILMIKEANPEFGCQRISDMLARGPSLPAGPTAVAKVLHEAGYEFHEEKTVPHRDKVRRFERAKPNQMWQTDLFSFVLKRQNRRVHLIAFMDDHSRFITGFGLHASASSALVIEVFRSAIDSYNPPEEVLTDNGSQYITWRGKSAFAKECERRGINQIVARPRHPQTLGKVERFWGTLWRECIESAIFRDLGDARERISLFIDYYNFQRPHRGIEGLVPADRFFHAAPEVKRAIKEKLEANALEIARNGKPKKQVYLAGQVDGKPFSMHSEGDRVILMGADNKREEVDLVSSTPQGILPSSEEMHKETPPPGVSSLDECIKDLESIKEEDKKDEEE
ncbi:MAG: DDE-type integrase/transposase/recombinase [Planctomycetota bacterium]|jgi:transposase InsO family protein